VTSDEAMALTRAFVRSRTSAGVKGCGERKLDEPATAGVRVASGVFGLMDPFSD